MKDIILVCPECGRVIDGMDIKKIKTYHGRIYIECPFCGYAEDEMFFKKEYPSEPYRKMINVDKIKEHKDAILKVLIGGAMILLGGLVLRDRD